MQKEFTVLVGLYAAFEIVKWILNWKQKNQTCALSQATQAKIDAIAASANKPAKLSDTNQRKLDDLWDWHNLSDDEGRKLWYTPKTLHTEQERMVDLLRDIANSQETTARILGELVRKLERIGGK